MSEIYITGSGVETGWELYNFLMSYIKVSLSGKLWIHTRLSIRLILNMSCKVK